MVTQELHIELDILLQKINSHWNQNLLPQEKDLFINREITRYINRRISRLGNKRGEGLFDTVKRTTELAPLITTVSLPVIINESKEAEVLLPFDFLYYITSEASTCCSCLNVTPVTSVRYEATFSPIKEPSLFSLSASQGLFNFNITPNDLPSDYLIETRIPAYKNDIGFVKALLVIIEKYNTTDIEFTYDKVNNVFIARSYSPFTLGYNTPEGYRHIAVKAISYTRYPSPDFPLMSRIDAIDEEFSRPIKQSYLSGAKDEKGLVTLRGDKLIYTFKSVISDRVNLTYLKKPRKIDLLLQSNSELSDTTLEEVVADTAQRILGVLGADGYAKYVQENILIE